MKLEDVILRGDRASQPAANAVAVGTLYAVTDEDTIVERSTGAAWESYSPPNSSGFVDGPAGATTDGRVVLFDGVTGRLLKQGPRLEADLVAGPAAAVADRIATFNGVGGKTVKDSGKTIADVMADALAAANADIIPIDLASEVTGTLARTKQEFSGRPPDIRASFTAPVHAAYTDINFGSDTKRDDTDSTVLIGAASGSGSRVVARVKAAPATPYTVTAYLQAHYFAKPFMSYGLCFRNSGAGTLHALQIVTEDLGLTLPRLRSSKYTNPTTFSADYASVIQFMPYDVHWLRIADDGVNRICSVSRDGIDWVQVHSVGRTDFLTADQIGFCISTENSGTPNYAPVLRVLHWLEA